MTGTLRTGTKSLQSKTNEMQVYSDCLIDAKLKCLQQTPEQPALKNAPVVLLQSSSQDLLTSQKHFSIHSV
ncbi:hypothetical protein JG688_00017442, partial [Phytophthora aleatoria]